MSNKNLVSIVLVCVVLSAMSVVGCNKSSGPDTYEVSGTLTHNGEPIAQMEVIFLPEDTGLYRESLAITDAEGKFTMMYTNKLEGVAPGSNTVYVRDPASINGDQTSTEASYVAVLEKYGDPATSPMKVTIEDDQVEYELKLD